MKNSSAKKHLLHIYYRVHFALVREHTLVYVNDVGTCNFMESKSYHIFEAKIVRCDTVSATKISQL